MNMAQWRRLARIEEQIRPDDGGFAVWVGTGEDGLVSPTGEVLTLEEFERRYPDAVSLDEPLPDPSQGAEDGLC